MEILQGEAVTLAVWGVAGLSVLLTIVGAVVLAKRWRRSRFAEYGFEIKEFALPQDGLVRYAQWLHPKERAKSVSQEHVNAWRQWVREGDTVIDIGAHTGDSTLPLALAAGRSGCVFAFEPNPYVYKILLKNSVLNPAKTNIVPLNFAATERDGVYTFHYSDGAYCNGGFLSQISDQGHKHRQPLEVHGRNLCDYLSREYPDRLPRLSFIKVDTEGYDRQVLLSLLDLIKKYRPVIACEVYKRLTRNEREAMYDVLAQAGYCCFKLGEGSDLQGEAVERDGMENWEHFDILALPREKVQRAAA